MATSTIHPSPSTTLIHNPPFHCTTRHLHSKRLNIRPQIGARLCTTIFKIHQSPFTIPITNITFLKVTSSLHSLKNIFYLTNKTTYRIKLISKEMPSPPPPLITYNRSNTHHHLPIHSLLHPTTLRNTSKKMTYHLHSFQHLMI